MSEKGNQTPDKPELVFSDLPVGRKFRSLEYHITETLVRNYMDTLGDHHPMYWDETRAANTASRASIAPPGLAAVYARSSYLQDHAMPSGGVLAKQEFEFKRAARVGDTLMVRAQVIESYLDEKGRKRVTFLIEAENQNAEPMTTVRLFAIWPK